MDGPCQVDGCTRTLDAHSARRMCQAHYLRWKATGDPGPATIKEYKRDRVCSVEGCGRAAKARGWCGSHYARWKQLGDTGPAELRPYKPTGTGQFQYSTAHARVHMARGKASAEQCQHCGGSAQQWAYDHLDPAEVWTAWVGSLVVFSLDPAHYIPLCIPCHRKFDQSARAVT